MTGVIVALPKIDDAKNIKNLLVRNGIPVMGICTAGAQAIACAQGLQGGIVLCGYKLADMIYSQLREDLPEGFDMLVIASRHVISENLEGSGVMSLSMPLKVHELVDTIDLMSRNMEQRRLRARMRPRERDDEERRLIGKAKEVLMSRNHMTEQEAHKYIQKCSMDSGTNMTETAQMVLAMMKGS